MPLTVVILTFNEQKHIERAILSVKDIATKILVVDSGSTDATVEIATRCGAEVIVNDWVNHATQFNWALEQLDADTDWVMRLDADEYVTSSLREQVLEKLPNLAPNKTGICVSRRMAFLGKTIKYGGVFPIRIVRFIRYGHGHCENRLMDEHLVVERGEIVDLTGEIIDDNLSPLSWWVEKHNRYASLEAIELLNLEIGFLANLDVSLSTSKQASVKRWIKEHLYAKSPTSFRALVYFAYRYFLRLGFLDGKEGTAFHFLQGFWYRYLVDTKLYEVKKHMIRHNVNAPTAIYDVLGIEVGKKNS